MDKAKEQVRLQGDRTYVLQEAIKSCRKGGTISMPGAYVGGADTLPLGAFMNKGLTLKTGQTHMQHYMKRLLEMIESNKIDPSFVITHRVKLSDAPEAYKKFRDKKDGCIKVVLYP
jgi:threonine dehydrogenase-like Zn-dependent dehydrogenase